MSRAPSPSPSNASSAFEEGDLGMFEEPPGFRPPSPEPTFTHFDRPQGPPPARLELRLPPKHSLWGHWLWNAGRVGADYIDAHPALVKGKAVCELGAGSALPSLVAMANGARIAAITDYPERVLLQNIEYNVRENFPGALEENRAAVVGFLWGSDPQPLLEVLPAGSKFDFMILTDLIFNHSQHTNLVSSLSSLLAADGRILLTFSSHVPKKRHMDLAFFPMLEENGFEVEEQFDKMMEPMFGDESYVESSDEDRRIRATVHLYVYRRKA